MLTFPSSGLGFREIIDMCGTRVAQIERTYHHLSDEIIRPTNAVADYRKRADGTIEVMDRVNTIYSKSTRL